MVDDKPECAGLSSRSWGWCHGAGIRVGFWLLIAQIEPRYLYVYDAFASPVQLCHVGAAKAAIVELASGTPMPAVEQVLPYVQITTSFHDLEYSCRNKRESSQCSLRKKQCNGLVQALGLTLAQSHANTRSAVYEKFGLSPVLPRCQRRQMLIAAAGLQCPQPAAADVPPSPASCCQWYP